MIRFFQLVVWFCHRRLVKDEMVKTFRSCLRRRLGIVPRIGFFSNGPAAKKSRIGRKSRSDLTQIDPRRRDTSGSVIALRRSGARLRTGGGSSPLPGRRAFGRSRRCGWGVGPAQSWGRPPVLTLRCAQSLSLKIPPRPDTPLFRLRLRSAVEAAWGGATVGAAGG